MVLFSAKFLAPTPAPLLKRRPHLQHPLSPGVSHNCPHRVQKIRGLAWLEVTGFAGSIRVLEAQGHQAEPKRASCQLQAGRARGTMSPVWGPLGLGPCASELPVWWTVGRDGVGVRVGYSRDRTPGLRCLLCVPPWGPCWQAPPGLPMSASIAPSISSLGGKLHLGHGRPDRLLLPLPLFHDQVLRAWLRGLLLGSWGWGA